MSQPPHPDVPAKEGATDAMAGSSFKQWNMTQPPQTVPDHTPRNMTQPTVPVPEASSSQSSAPLPATVSNLLEEFDYSWADLNMVRQQCKEFPRNKVRHSYYNFLTDLHFIRMFMGRSSTKNGSDLLSTYFPSVETHNKHWSCCAIKNTWSCTNSNCTSGAWT